MATRTLCGLSRLNAARTPPNEANALKNNASIKIYISQQGSRTAWNNHRLHIIAATAPPTLAATTATVKPKPAADTNLSETGRSAQPEVSSLPSTSSSTFGTLTPERAPPSRDPRRLAVFAGTLAAAGELSYVWFSRQAELPPLESVAGPLSAAVLLALVSVPISLLAAKAILRDQFHFELHRGRLYVCAGVPSSGPPLAPGAVAVRPTGDVRGNGAFAAARISAGTHIADYSGDLLDRAAFQERYPDSVGDYAMAIDDEYVIDAASIAPYTATFHAVHMNHSRTRANVRRYYKRSEGRVAFFASRDIEVGEELLYDYGRSYWYGREHLEMP